MRGHFPGLCRDFRSLPWIQGYSMRPKIGTLFSTECCQPMCSNYSRNKAEQQVRRFCAVNGKLGSNNHRPKELFGSVVRKVCMLVLFALCFVLCAGHVQYIGDVLFCSFSVRLRVSLARTMTSAMSTLARCFQVFAFYTHHQIVHGTDFLRSADIRTLDRGQRHKLTRIILCSDCPLDR